MAITLSHGGPTIYRSPVPSKQVLVGTIQGVVWMERDPDGPGWHVAHRALTDKHIHALLIEPDSGTIFAGVNHGTIFASGETVGSRSTTSIAWRAPDCLGAHAFMPERSRRTCSLATISAAPGRNSRP